jgi:serine/threonine protein kinase HipA of HipAB toxin-antitoxin module
MEKIMISLNLTDDELVEIANHTAFTAFSALEDDDEEAWRIAVIAVSILDKLEAAHPALIEAEHFDCAKEMLLLRRRVAARSKK